MRGMIVEHVMLHWPHVVSLNVGFPLTMFACWIATHLHLLVFSSNYMIICAPSGFPTLIPTHAIFYFRCASECDLWTGEQPVQPASMQPSATWRFSPPSEGFGLYLTNACEFWVRCIFVSDAGCSFPQHDLHLLSILSACLGWSRFSDLLNGIRGDYLSLPNHSTYLVGCLIPC